MTQLTLKAWRINANLKRSEVANILGKTERTIYNWEKGLQIPDKSNLDKLAEIYHASSDQIFLGDNLALSERYSSYRQSESR